MHLVETGFTYQIDNQELFDTLKQEFYSHPEHMVSNGSKQNKSRSLGTLWPNKVWGFEHDFWESHVELFEYINSVTYPHDPDYIVSETWLKFYEEGDFFSLHYDYPLYLDENPDAKDLHQYSNVIMIDQSDDLKGGVLVIAGDSFNIDYFNANRKGFLLERLYTKSLEKPGDAIVWNENTIHGVSKVEKGQRLILLCLKAHKDKWCVKR